MSQEIFHFDQPPALVIGACGHGLALIHGLHEQHVPCLVLEANLKQPGVRTRHAQVLEVTDINGQGLIDSLIDLRPRIYCPGQPVLILTNDSMVRTLGQHWERLEGLYHLSWAHARQALLPLLEKSELEARCDFVGLNYPKTFVLQSRDEVDAALRHVPLPIFVKPVRPLSGFKTAQPRDREQLIELAEQHASDLPFLVQQFIPGDDSRIHFGALYLDAGNVLARFDGRKLRSRPLGHTSVAEPFPDDRVFQATQRFFDGLQLSGPVSLELKRDAEGKLWVIEPTVGRTDFWVGLCIANGVNLPALEHAHQSKTELPAATQLDRAVWFNEQRDPFGRWWLRRRGGRAGRSAAHLFLHMHDPAPALLFAASFVRQAVAALARPAARVVRRTGDKRTLLSQDTDPEPKPAVASVSWHRPQALPEDVRTLMSQVGRSQLELSSDWYELLCSTVFEESAEAGVWVLRRNATLVAVLPTRREGARLFALSNYYSACYEPWIHEGLTSADLLPLIQALSEASPAIGEYRFSPMDPRRRTYSVLRDALVLAGLRPQSFFCFGNWYQPVDSDWSSYLQRRDGQLRSTIRRAGKRLIAAGGSIELLKTSDELERGLAAFQQVYAKSWKTAEPYPQFIAGLMRLTAKQEGFRLGLVWLGGKPIAAQFWYVIGSRACIYKLAYDESYKALAPGTVLSAHMMQQVIDVDSVEEIDYLIGDDAYKARWMDRRRERWGLAAFDRRHPAGLLAWLRTLLGRMLRHHQPIGAGAVNTKALGAAPRG